MGLSVSAAAAILFIATAIVFGTMVSAFDHAQGSIIDAQRQSSARAADTENTKITFVDRWGSNISLINSGTVTLRLENIDVLLNGTLSNGNVSSMSIENRSETNLWLPNETLIIAFDKSLEMAKIKVIAGNGASVYV